MLRWKLSDVLSRRRIPDRQFELWKHTQLTIDAVPGRGAGFSLEAPEGFRFLTRSRVFTEEEAAELAVVDPATRGPEAPESG
jgi:uncharacterized protein (DUF779 family)